MRLQELGTVNDQYDELSNRLARVSAEIQQKIANPKLDHIHMQIEFINKKIETHMAVQDATDQDTSYVVKETNNLRKDFLGLEKRVLVERYP